MSFPLFKLYDNDNDVEVDYTKNILVPSYQVLEYDMSESWTDGFGRTHRAVYRTKIGGKFTMTFQSYDEYHDFMRVLNSNRGEDEDYYLVSSLYLINKRDTKRDLEMLVAMQPTLNPTKLGGINDLEVSMEER